MTQDRPLTEQDFWRGKGVSEAEWRRMMDLLKKVQSAKRLLNQRLSNEVKEIIALIVNDDSITMSKRTFEYIRDRTWDLMKLPDACFQIDDKESKGDE